MSKKSEKLLKKKKSFEKDSKMIITSSFIGENYLALLILFNRNSIFTYLKDQINLIR